MYQASGHLACYLIKLLYLIVTGIYVMQHYNKQDSNKETIGVYIHVIIDNYDPLS